MEEQSCLVKGFMVIVRFGVFIMGIILFVLGYRWFLKRQNWLKSIFLYYFQYVAIACNKLNKNDILQNQQNPLESAKCYTSEKLLNPKNATPKFMTLSACRIFQAKSARLSYSCRPVKIPQKKCVVPKYRRAPIQPTVIAYKIL
ncbi:MAG: hypothetical protein GY749_19880 [Desulfobacteraceae bacterium]|nr:hypothetical protein [Desulfobacteraceae bacterium]